ncbi:MAG: hypothetical protein AB8H80_10860 [Planctomycetota bacterium]
MPRPHALLLPAVLAASLTAPSCTLAKPFVCAVTTPIYALGNGAGGGGGGGWGCCQCADGRAIAIGLLALSAVGAVGGLITGIVSDVNYLFGDVPEPARNLHDPFATNTSEGSF